MGNSLNVRKITARIVSEKIIAGKGDEQSRSRLTKDCIPEMGLVWGDLRNNAVFEMTWSRERCGRERNQGPASRGIIFVLRMPCFQ